MKFENILHAQEFCRISTSGAHLGIQPLVDLKENPISVPPLETFEVSVQGYVSNGLRQFHYANKKKNNHGLIEGLTRFSWYASIKVASVEGFIPTAIRGLRTSVNSRKIL